jgi:putative lipoprotein
MRRLIPILWIFNFALVFSAPTSSYANNTFRGHLVWGHEVRSFKPCGMEVEYWVVDRTGGELWHVYQGLSRKPYQPIYVEVRGHLQPPPSAGFGTDYERQLTVFELRRAGLETRGCAEDLEGIAFRAYGNEPFWDVEISENGIVFSQLGQPRTAFPYTLPDLSETSRVYRSITKEPPQHRIEISLREKRCIDSMSGEHFSFAAQVKLDGRRYVGCAKEGCPPVSETDISLLGTYVARPRAADSPGRVITLTLDEGRLARMTYDFLNNKPPINQTGAWTCHRDGFVTVWLRDRDGRPISENIIFKVKGQTLEAVGYDKNLLGSEWLILEKRIEQGGQTHTRLAPSAKPLTIKVLKNAEYQSEFAINGSVRLSNGIYKGKIVPGSASELIVRLGDQIAFGDLNRDGAEDAVVVLITDPGGSGVFRHLGVVINEKGSPQHVASQRLGDRVRVKSLSVRSGEIIVQMMTHGPMDPMCCPTLQVTQNYILQEDKLVIANVRELMKTKWALRSFAVKDSEDLLVPRTAISLEFASDAKLHGSGGCNRYFAAYEIGPGDSLKIRGIGSTRLACPEEFMDQEMRYFEALQRVSTFRIQKNLLQLLYEKGQRFLNFIPAPSQ